MLGSEAIRLVAQQEQDHECIATATISPLRQRMLDDMA